ncbi:flagellar hook-associated protein FlgK [Kineosporia sp. R_H_3]|uniref:flagellar hook-associated protein FlgK n=1 Tax=Kineosporia sp. R_H_3 TaxID=1961848 RepID=UPI000B4B9963|nr:flagellar hook-associated protein FlgK [Kineosporia sp. R_H_3]
MTGGFSTLNTARSGLAAAQRAMDVTGQNVVNANTPGYSRQRVVMSSSGAGTGASFFSGQQATFGGVGISDVTRIRDTFLESTRAAAGGRQQALTTQTDAMSGVEQLLSEPGDAGLQTALSDFFNSWHDIAVNPSTDNTAPGAVTIQNGIKVASQLHSLAYGLATQWTTVHSALEDTVAQANQQASDLAVLNGKIREGVISGRPVNELLDTRDVIVRSLSDLLGGIAAPGEDGMVSVAVGGVSIVSGTEAQQLTIGGAPDLSTADTDPPVIYWGTTVVPVESGKALGQLAALRTDIPSVQAAVDEIALAMRDAVNSIHTAGFTLSGVAGTDFFTGTDAMTMSVAVSDPQDLAVATVAGTIDASNAARIGDLIDDTAAAGVLGGPGPMAQWRELTTSLGVQLKSLKVAGQVQGAVVQASDDALEANAGVSLDEEMTNMILYQRSYQASARVISTVDEMLDTLINRTGR